MRVDIGKPNPSQKPGTLKNTFCLGCNEKLNHLSAEQQEKHVKECFKQKKLI